jgi:hypothetical protein
MVDGMFDHQKGKVQLLFKEINHYIKRIGDTDPALLPTFYEAMLDGMRRFHSQYLDHSVETATTHANQLPDETAFIHRP